MALQAASFQQQIEHAEQRQQRSAEVIHALEIQQQQLVSEYHREAQMLAEEHGNQLATVETEKRQAIERAVSVAEQVTQSYCWHVD